MFERSRGNVTSDGQVFVINDMGMPLFHNNKRFGRYLVNISVTYPETLTKKQLDIISKAFE